MRTSSFLDAKTQQRVIVYNVPQKLAMDLIDGRKYWFVGDSDLLEDDFIRNFHIKPSRVLQRIDPAVNPENIYRQGNFINFYGKKILLLDKTVRFNHVKDKIQVDLLILSGNPKLYFNKLAETFTIKQAVFDSRCPAWKVNYWKRDCDSLQIRYHDVSEKGAFVMNLR